jgi:hypothetical protein
MRDRQLAARVTDGRVYVPESGRARAGEWSPVSHCRQGCARRWRRRLSQRVWPTVRQADTNNMRIRQVLAPPNASGSV